MALPFTNSWMQKMLGIKSVTGSGTVTGFFDQSAGYTVELTVDHSATSTFRDSPLATFTDDAGAAPEGVLIWPNLAKTDGGQFSVILERASGGTYEPLTGDFLYVYLRKGRKH